MRLTQQEIAAIRTVATDQFGPDAQLSLFGSRTDDSRRGGDIDLLVEISDAANCAELLQRRSQFLAALWRRIDERKIDVVLSSATASTADPVFLEAVRADAQSLGTAN